MKNLLLLLSIVLFFSCKPRKGEFGHDCDSHCPKDQVCTTEYVMLGVLAEDASGNPVALDKMVVTRIADNSVVTFEANNGLRMHNGKSMYWNDGLLSKTNREGESIVIQGFVNNVLVFTQTMKVGHDCCHVKLFQGSQTIKVSGM